jgi:hypothetical protein
MQWMYLGHIWQQTYLVWVHKQLCENSKRVFHAIKEIRPNFTKDELKTVITSYFFSILYYNSKIWHLQNLSFLAKKRLLSASALSLKLCTPNYDRSTSNLDLDHISKRATPSKFIKYKLSILFYKIYRSNKLTTNLINLNYLNLLLSRNQIFLETTNISNYKIPFFINKV